MRGRLEARVEQALAASSRRIVVTGAGGWLGMATLECLHSALGEELDSRVACFGSRRRTLQLLGGSRIEQRPLAELALLDARPSLVLHLAFLTRDRAETMDEQAYVAANRALSGQLLAALGRIGAEGVFVASSGAAGLADDPRATAATRLYGRLKREDEDAFAAWAEERRKRAVVARIFNLSGPHINKQDSYALACFIRDALADRPIAVRSPHPVVRSYVAIRELMSLVFALLLADKPGAVRFDTGGERVELGELAAAVARIVGGGPVARPAGGDGEPDLYAGDGAAYAGLLAGHSIRPVPIAEQIAETADFLAAFREPSAPSGLAMEPQRC